MVKKVFLFVLICAIIVNLHSIAAVATAPDETDDTEMELSDINTSELIPNCQQIEVESNDLSLEITSTIVNASDSVDLVLPNKNILSYSYDADGITVSESQSDSTRFQIMPTERFGSFDIYANYKDGTIGEDTIYFFHDYGMTFASDFTLDDAFHKGMQFLLEEGSITSYEYTQEYAKLTQSFISLLETPIPNNVFQEQDVANSLTMTATQDTISISGYVYWMPSDSTILPLKYVKLTFGEYIGQVYYELDNIYTNEEGYFFFEVDTEDLSLSDYDANYCIRIFSESANIKVNYDDPYYLYYYEYTLPETPEIGNTYSIGGLLIRNSGNMAFYRAQYILQCMIVGERFAKAMGADLPNETVNVIYPFVFDSWSAFSWQGIIPIGENLYNYPDTIIHEYGHYVQQTLGFYGADLEEIISNGPQHGMCDDQLSENGEHEYAMELVWSESWATIFSAIAQQYYPEYSNGITGWGNEWHNGVNFESPYCDDNVYHFPDSIFENASEFQELAVTAFLWDLYDSSADTNAVETHDSIALGAQSWWNRTAIEEMYTLPHFMAYITANYPHYLDEIGSIMSEYRISARNVLIKNPIFIDATVSPVISWFNCGAPDFPNNNFQICIYDAYGNELGATEWIIDYSCQTGEYLEYTIPSDLWSEIVKNYKGDYTIQICIKTMNVLDLYNITGPYPSKFIPITLYKPTENITMTSSGRYLERVVKLDKGSSCDFNITFQTSGNKIFQTFGTKDTMLELYASDGTLLASDDDDGYNRNALISYEAQANVQYKIRIKFYSSYVYGETKIAIIPARYLKSHDSATINSYEAIYHVQNALPVEFGAYTEQDYVMVFRYIVPTSGDYTFTIASDLDTYMYVIDPRSSELLVVNVNYNDDSGEGMNPLITTHLDAGVPYLIIFSAYNPHNPTVAGGSTLTISITEA